MALAWKEIGPSVLREGGVCENCMLTHLGRGVSNIICISLIKVLSKKFSATNLILLVL